METNVVPTMDELFERCSNWGRWGPDDQRGALNFITPAHVRRAAELVREGLTISLSLPLATTPGPANPRPVTHLMLSAGDVVTGDGGFSADYFAMIFHGFANTHLDALCHIFHKGHMYNGFPASKVTSRQALAGDVEAASQGIVTRGILLDIPRLRDVDWLEPGEPIMVEDLERAEAAAGVTVETGDFLLVRTGRHARAAAGLPPERILNVNDGMQSLAGLHFSTLPWLHDREIAILGGDGINDVIPTGHPDVNPIHRIGMAGMGLHLLDNADLEPLGAACAERGRWEFQIVLAPLRLRGGTGSPANPIAIL